MSDPKELIGAPSTLKWLQEKDLEEREKYAAAKQELLEALRDEIDNPPDKDGEDFSRRAAIARTNVEFAEERIFKTQKMLLLYDKAIPESKRDSTEQLSRQTVENYMKLAVITTREAGEQLITQYCQEALGCKNEQDLYRLFAEKWRGALGNSFSSAVRERHLPAWFKDSISEIL